LCRRTPAQKIFIPKSLSRNDAVEDVLWTRAKLFIKKRIALKNTFPSAKA